MAPMTVDIIIKVETLEEAKKILSGLKEIKAANPDEEIKTTIKIGLGD